MITNMEATVIIFLRHRNFSTCIQISKTVKVSEVQIEAAGIAQSV